MKTWETICNIEKNNKLHIIFSRKMILRSSMMPLLCSLRSSFRGAGSRRYRPSSPASMVPRILSFLFLVLCPSASSCDIPPPSSCTLDITDLTSVRSKSTYRGLSVIRTTLSTQICTKTVEHINSDHATVIDHLDINWWTKSDNLIQRRIVLDLTCGDNFVNVRGFSFLFFFKPTRSSWCLYSQDSTDSTVQYTVQCVCVVFSSHSFWTSSSLDVPAGVIQEESHTGFLIHLLSAVRAFIFLARRIQPFLSLVDRKLEFCVLTI